jgi:hypothetical protein
MAGGKFIDSHFKTGTTSPLETHTIKCIVISRTVTLNAFNESQARWLRN